jgi:hypothetical protein
MARRDTAVVVCAAAFLCARTDTHAHRALDGAAWCCGELRVSFIAAAAYRPHGWGVGQPLHAVVPAACRARYRRSTKPRFCPRARRVPVPLPSSHPTARAGAPWAPSLTLTLRRGWWAKRQQRACRHRRATRAPRTKSHKRGYCATRARRVLRRRRRRRHRRSSRNRRLAAYASGAPPQRRRACAAA